METVTIERAGVGQAIAIVGGSRFAARFDGTLRRWRVQTDAGEQMSVGAKLHSIGKLFGTIRAQVEGARVVELEPAVTVSDPAVAAQVRRMLASMREFGFESFWQDHDNQYGCDTGHTVRVAGDPIYDTIGQVAGVQATRADTIEALAAVVDGRRPNLPPRMQVFPAAIKLVAEALAAGRRVMHVGGFPITITGPIMPVEGDAVKTLVEAIANNRARVAAREQARVEERARIVAKFEADDNPIMQFARELDAAPKVADAPFALQREARITKSIQPSLFKE